MMRIIGLAGWSGSGKTTLVTNVIPVLVKRGLKVATVKHAHHEFDIDQPGKDSWLHRQAGASEVAIVSSRRWAIVHELGDEPEPPLGDVLAKLSPVDLVIANFEPGSRRVVGLERDALRAGTDETAPVAPGALYGDRRLHGRQNGRHQRAND